MAMDRPHPLNNPTSPWMLLRALPRTLDTLPLWGQINITWQCNLDCAYCTEYDNSKGHVPYDEVCRRIDHCADLGTRYIGLIGGEPMLHPDLTNIFRRVTQRGMGAGMTTNAFLLTREKLDEYIDAGLGLIQISVDAVKPTKQIPKSLKTLRKKIEMVAGYPIVFRVNTVLCEQTLDEVEEVAQLCFDLGVEINFSVIHDRGRLNMDWLAKNSTTRDRYLSRIEWLRQHKREGRGISTPYYLMHYYDEALKGRPMDWTCLGGQKCYYVTPEGYFQYCSQVPSTRLLLDVTREDLAKNGGRKGCEENCGVDCVIHTSLPYSNKREVFQLEAREHLLRIKDRVTSRLPVLGT